MYTGILNQNRKRKILVLVFRTKIENGKVNNYNYMYLRS